MDKFREIPIHLININNSGFFEITSEGSEFLSLLTGKKICVVSITGPYRSGKSFLANLLMNSMSGFKTGSTTNACTKGLWVWGKPFQVDKDTFLLIIDSEGLGSVEKDRELNIDLKIFTLCVLASSVLIYNSKHAINEEKIEELANVANLSNRIKLKAINSDQLQLENKNDPNLEKERIISFFPKLMWIIRDFSLNLNEMSSNQYLEQCLSSNEMTSTEKLESREIIKKNFKNRECFTLVIPTNDKKKIQNLEYEDKSVIRKEFIEEIEKLVDRIKSEYIIKCFNGVELDGMTFLGVLQHFIESLNNNEAPVILNSLENVLLAKSSKKQEEYFERFKSLFMFSEVQTIKDNKVYKQITKIELPVNLNEILTNYFDNLAKIQMDFSKSLPSSFSPEQVGTYQNKFFTRTQVEFFNCLEANNEYMEAWIELEFSNIIKILNNTITNNFKIISKDNEDYTIELEKPDDLVKYCFIVTQEISHQLLTKLNFFPDKFTSKVLEKFNKLLETNVFNKIKNMTKNLNEKIQQVVSNLQEEKDRFAITAKNLREQIINEKRLVDEIKKEKNEIYLSKVEVESKYENLLRDMRNKEREFTNNISIEVQKYSRMENYYTNMLKEKNTVILENEVKLSESKKLCALMEKEISNKKIEFNKESSILSLKVEIEKLKSQNKGMIMSSQSSNNITEDDSESTSKSNKELVNFQISNVLKQIQSLCLEFKEEIDKFDKEKESVFRKKIFEITDKELEKRSNSFVDDINLIKETLFDEYKSNFERKNREMSVEISDLKLKINQLELTIIEEKSTIDYYKNKINSFEKQLVESRNTCQSKDSLVDMLKDQLNVFEQKQKEWFQSKDDFEVKIYEIGSALKIKDDEIDTIIMLIDSILSKNKKKYDNQIYSLDDEIKNTLNKLIVEYKIFK